MKFKYLLTVVLYMLCMVSTYANSRNKDISKVEEEIYYINKRIDNIEYKDNYYKSDIKFSGKIYLEATTSNNKGNAYNYLGGNSGKRKFDNIQLKNANLGIKKQLNKFSDFNFKIKSSGDRLKLDSVYLTVKIQPGLSIDLGQINIPLTLENEDCSNSYSFIGLSRYYTSGNLFLCNGIGAKMKYIGDGFGYFIGAFGNSFQDNINEVNKNILSARTYINPYIFNNNVVHLGINYYNAVASYNKDRKIPFQSSKSDFFNLQFDLKQRENIGAEFALNLDWFNIQSEISRGSVTPAAVNFKKRFDVSNFYTQFNFVLTGESLKYSEGSFERFKVANPLFTGGYGHGAYELSLRFARTDLQDRKSGSVFDYGKYKESSIALNWMPNDFVKTIFQYSRINESYIDKLVILANNNKKNSGYNLFSFKTKIFF